MKIEPLTVRIGDEDVTFGVIGFRIYVDASEKIRETKEKAFGRVVANLMQDPLSAATTASSAIDGYMAGMIVSDYEVRQWLFSPEGEYFMFSYSIRKLDPAFDEKKIEQLYDEMSFENKFELSRYYTLCITKTLPKQEEDEDSKDSDVKSDSDSKE